jgi:hypothetical protein
MHDSRSGTPISLQVSGVPGLQDRSAAPSRADQATSSGAGWLHRLRQQRWTGAQIALALQLNRTTVAAICGGWAWPGLRALDPPIPVQRGEWNVAGA